MKNSFSTPGFLWPLLTLICIVTILYGLHLVLKKAGWTAVKRQRILLFITLGIAAWVSLVTVLAYKGFFADFTKIPPRSAMAILAPLPVVLLLAFSKTGTALLKSVPPHWLVFMQSFRIMVELLLWFAFLAGKLPVQMTFEGGNLDVITGMLALPTGYILLKKKRNAKKVAIAFNILGMVLLLNILVIAVLSMPTSFQYFINEPANTIVAQFPFILLPAVLVPVAYSFHLFSLRQLFILQTTRVEAPVNILPHKISQPTLQETLY